MTLNFQLSIPEDFGEITAGLVSAISSSVNEEDQSKQNLNLVLDILRKIANYCKSDSVRTNRYNNNNTSY